MGETLQGSECFHGDEPEVEMSDGLVHVFQETRDMYDMNDPNIYVVLDEGCNSTCHSKHWAEVVETKLKNLGYQFPFKDTKEKLSLDWGLVGPRPKDPKPCLSA